ncbi:MAG TPA: hypothetical protein PKV17_03700 [Aquabacterium sp.]|nr:hypothetical protein [Aquabacterium sp.]HRH27866.1 hypothetical protein [Aquabacterium sp.]
MTPAAKAILAVTTLVVGVVLLGLAQSARRSEQRHLLKNGARTKGKVISLGRESQQAGMPMILRYRFIPEGSSEPVDGHCIASVWAPYAPGDEAIICYNRAHPVSSIILSPKGRPL